MSQESGRFSPAFLNFGRNLNSPNSEFNKVTAKAGVRDPKCWLDRIRRIGAYHDLIKRSLHKSSKRQAKNYNVGRVEAKFKVGDLVMRKDHHLSNANTCFSAKLAKPFSGPYKIIRQISNNVFELDMPGSQKNPKTHVRFLRKFIPRESCVSGDNCTAMDQHEEDPYFPPIQRVCFNCGGNHNHRVCTRPRRVFCYLCGWPDVTKARCPQPSCREAFQTS